MLINKKYLFIFVFMFMFMFVSMEVWGTAYYRDNFRDIRWLGRGNTGIAVITDGTAAFYNPGGIAANRTLSFSLLNPSLAVNYDGAMNAATLSQLLGGDSDDILTVLEPIAGKPVTVMGSVFPHISVPYFMFGLWDYLDASFEYRNPVNPTLQADGRNDRGIVVGAGTSILDRIHVGTSLRYQIRQSATQVVTADALLNATDTQALIDEILRTGTGYGMNLGIQYEQPLTGPQYLAFGLAVEDFGFTKFKNKTIAPDPLSQAQMINLGLAYGFSSTVVDGLFLLDYKMIREDSVHPSKKIFIGAEFDLPIITARGGLFQGNWTAGFSMALLPVLDLDFATYAEELDYAAGIRTNRVYMIGLKTGLEVSTKGSKRGGFGRKGKYFKQKAKLDAVK